MLICVAGMPVGKRVLRFGKLVAEATQAEVTVLHVPAGDAQTERGEAILAAASAELGKMRHDTRLEQGAPAKVILRVADEGAYDLVAVGARSVQTGGEQPVGRVARQVVAGARTSVLVVKGEAASLKRVLLCSGGRPIAEPVISTGAQLAQAANAEVTLLHVSSAVPSMYTGLHAMEEGIEELLQRDTPESRHLRHSAEVLEQHKVKAVLELRHGVAADEIMRSIQSRDYDLIVLGASDAAPRLSRLFFGEVTGQLIERAPCSVLVARQRDRPATN